MPAVDTCPPQTFSATNRCSAPPSSGSWASFGSSWPAEIAPYAGDWWNKAEFPAHILPKLAALELSTPAQRGYSHLFAGLVIAEMTRVDTSIATFFLVHHDLFVESLYRFGSEDSGAGCSMTPPTSGPPGRLP